MLVANKHLDIHLEEIIEIYKSPLFDDGHGPEHIREVIKNCSDIVDEFDIDININVLITAAVYHDLGLQLGREKHHKFSSKIVKNSKDLEKFFTEEEIDIIALAVKEHRASNKEKVKSMYSKVLADADTIAFGTIKDMFKRAYNCCNNDWLDDIKFLESYKHLVGKYGENGYAKFHLKEIKNSQKMKEIREKLSDKEFCKKIWEEILSDIKS